MSSRQTKQLQLEPEPLSSLTGCRTIFLVFDGIIIAVVVKVSIQVRRMTSQNGMCVSGKLHYCRAMYYDNDIRAKVARIPEDCKDFADRLNARGYPGRWLRSVFAEIEYRKERPTALKPRASNDASVGDPELHVLKLTHNPVWDEIDLSPIWRELGDSWKEFGEAYSEFRFMASYSKPPALGNRLNKHNRDTFRAAYG
ncbi:hypothetical protein B0H11DRAFT_1923635 [Mycena galericulata]|nr:hypothetical protein B0H11DRAFT_1923635 [Mycena galericulata]